MHLRLSDSPRHLPLLSCLALSLLLLGACSDEVDDPALAPTSAVVIATVTDAPEPTPTSRPAGSAAIETSPPGTSTPTPGIEEPLAYEGYQLVGDFSYTDPIDFPENLLVLVETGCSQCDDPTEALYRVWRNEGQAHVDLLVDAAVSGSENASITSFALRPDLSDIVITVCTDCGGQGRPLVESPVMVYRSLDGGLTWRVIDTAPAGAPVFVRAITDDGIVMSDLDESLFYLRGAAIEPPEGADGLLHDSNRAGALRWLAGTGSSVLDATGAPIALVEPGSLVDAVATDGSDPEQSIVGWAISYVSGPFEGWTVTRIGPDGRHIGFRLDTVVAPVTVLSNGIVVGSISTADSPYGGTIGFIDAFRGTLTPIYGPLIQSPFGDGTRSLGRNMPQAALSGPFLRVTSGVNCLPIRMSTERRSQELTCAADGTLVYDLRNQTTVGGQEWSRVRLLDGREGYAVTGFLTSE